jgi:hypothetical protein
MSHSAYESEFDTLSTEFLENNFTIDLDEIESSHDLVESSYASTIIKGWDEWNELVEDTLDVPAVTDALNIFSNSTLRGATVLQEFIDNEDMLPMIVHLAHMSKYKTKEVSRAAAAIARLSKVFAQNASLIDADELLKASKLPTEY